MFLGILCNNYKDIKKLQTKYEFKEIKQNEKEKIELYLNCDDQTDIILSIKINYNIKIYNSDSSIVICPSLIEKNVNIKSVKAFDFICKYYTNLFETSYQLYINDNFCLTPILTNISPFPLIIEQLSIQQQPSNSNITIIDQIQNKTNNKNEIQLTENNGEYCDLYLMNIKNTTELNDIGSYIIKWRRIQNNSNNKMITNTTKFRITLNNNNTSNNDGYIVLKELGIQLHLDVPPYGIVLKPMYITYSLYNNTQQFIQLDIHMDTTDACIQFMFSGYKQVSLVTL